MSNLRNSIREAMAIGAGLSYYRENFTLEQAKNLLLEEGWVIIPNISKHRKPMMRTRRPRIIKYRLRHMNTAEFFYHVKLDRWATLGTHTINNGSQLVIVLFVERHD